MRSLARPNPDHNYNVDDEIAALRAYKDRVHQDPAQSRQIPDVGIANHVLIGSWNIANLGVHERRDDDLRIIAEILSWFELVAIQEVADNLDDFEAMAAHLPPHFAYVFNDRAGNDERSAFVYDTRRVTLGPKIGELVIVPSDRRYVRLDGIDRAFTGFNRNPFLASFLVDGVRLLLANCHLIYGPQGSAADRDASLELRSLEAYAISRWCDLRRDDTHAWTENILATGDFNIPRAQAGDAIFDALRERGLRFPPHRTRIPRFTNVSDSADYDQILITPGMQSRVIERGVFDFDGALFASIYDAATPAYWRRCAKYYVSDHRPLWMQFQLDDN